MSEFLPSLCGILIHLSLSRVLVVRVSSSWFLVVWPPQDMPSSHPSDVQLRYLDGVGRWVTTTLAEVDGAAVVTRSDERAAA